MLYKTAAFVALAAVSASALSPVEVEPLVAKLNAIQGDWQAGWNENWRDFELKDISKLMGWNKTKTAQRKHKLPMVLHKATAPAAFNSITNWPKCPTIGHITNQARCGAFLFVDFCVV
jgi:hypothetical protein